MSNPIVPALSFRSNHSSLPPPGHLLLITDRLASPGEFILHRTLATHFKEVKEGQAIVVSFASGFDHWRAIAAKSNVNLSQHLASKSLVFINGMSLSAYHILPSDLPSRDSIACPPLLNTGDISLRALYELIAQSLRDAFPTSTTESSLQRTVIIDDITLPELVGVPTTALTRFIRALRALCLSHSASLVVRAHASTASNTGFFLDSDLLRCLIDSCNAHIEVRPLASGRSGAVSGEIAVHQGGLHEDDGIMPSGRNTSMQYRLSDGGAVFFQKGMGAGVL